MSGFCCVSCVPPSCVLIWFVYCPHLMWLLVNSCPAVFVSLSMIYLCIYSPVCSVWFRLVYLLLPVFLWVCLALPCLDVSIKDYYFEFNPRLRVPHFSLLCARDRRPDQTVSGTPSPRFVLFVFSSFYLFLCFVSRGMPADRGRYPPPAVAIPSPPAGSLVPGLPLPQARRSREITPPTQARRIAADSCPPAAANPSPVDPVHTSRPGEPCLCLVVPTGTF